MSHDTVTASGGDSDGIYKLIIHLYPNQSGTDNECENSITNALNHMGQQLLEWLSIDYYEIGIDYAHPNLDDSGRLDFYYAFDDWVHQTGRSSYDGCHVGVDGSFSGGAAAPSDCSGCTSFVSSTVAVVGVGTFKEHFKNTAIQEVLHTSIRKDLGSVKEYLGDNNEHDLGVVYSDGSVSPMATGYEDTHARHGQCDTKNVYFGFYNTELTYCTKNSVYRTAEAEH